MRNKATTPDKTLIRTQSEVTKSRIQKQGQAKVLTGLKRLAELHIQDAQLRHPNMPAYALPKPKYQDKTANQLTKAILAFIRFEGGYAVRINTTGQYRQRPGMTGTWTHGTTKRGTADIHSIILNGLHLSVEVKIGRDRQSEAQKATELNINNAGGKYWLVGTFQEFFDRYNEIKLQVNSTDAEGGAKQC